MNELSRRKAVRDKRIRFVKKTGERIWVSMNTELDRDTEDDAYHLAARLKEEMESVQTPSVEWKRSGRNCISRASKTLDTVLQK